jgi:Zn-finger nucleic acid-binding protein
MELTCPKCSGAMRSYERSGILIDQCTECRGVFLDRGDLDKLIDAEAEHQQASATAASQGPAWGTPQPRGYEGRHPDDLPYRDDRYRDERYSDDRYRDDRYRDHHRYDDDHRYGKKRKRSFLDDLFD